MSRRQKINYSSFVRKEEYEEKPVEVISDPAEEVGQAEEPKEEVKEKVSELAGVVSNCSMVNVRKAPSSEADILATIPKDERVKLLEPKDFNKEYYKVVTKSLEEGYIKKDFITIVEE